MPLLPRLRNLMARKTNPPPPIAVPPGWSAEEAAEVLRGIEGGLIRRRAEQLAMVADRSIAGVPGTQVGLDAVEAAALSGDPACRAYQRLVLQAEARFTLRCTEAIMGSQSATAIGTLLQRRDRDYALKPPTDGREVQHPTAAMSVENLLQTLGVSADANGCINLADLTSTLEKRR